MQLTIHSKVKFPYVWMMETLGGRYSSEGERYYEEHEEELSGEYGEIMETISDRAVLGGSKKIHLHPNSLRS